MCITYLFIFVLGAVFGSFLSAFTYRVVRGKSVLKGRSYCPKCKKKISWYDNIPLLSYILLKGRCRNCGKIISLLYPLLELSSGFLFLGVFLKAINCTRLCGLCGNDLICSWVNTNFILGYAVSLILVLVLISIFITDIEEMIIPDSIVFFGLFIFYIFYAAYFPSDLFRFLLSGFSAGSFLLFLHLLTLGKGMGLGDVKFAVFGGFILGPKLTITWLFLSFILGALIGLLLLAMKKAKFGKQIPFGPYLVISFIIVMFFGSGIYKFLNLPF